MSQILFLVLLILKNAVNQYINFPFIYLDNNNNEIFDQKELLTKIEDIIDGKNLYIKKS